MNTKASICECRPYWKQIYCPKVQCLVSHLMRFEHWAVWEGCIELFYYKMLLWVIAAFLMLYGCRQTSYMNISSFICNFFAYIFLVYSDDGFSQPSSCSCDSLGILLYSEPKPPPTHTLPNIHTPLQKMQCFCLLLLLPGIFFLKGKEENQRIEGYNVLIPETKSMNYHLIWNY